jgi:hypothetical protein
MVQIGYYPGQAIARRPRPPKPIPPAEYDLDVINQWIKNLDLDVQHMPSYVKEQVIADIKRQLKLSANVRKETYNVQTALEYGDLDETPNVELDLNLNINDWIKDPEKELKSTAQSVKDDIFNWTDFVNYVERRYFWEPIISGRDELSPVGEKPILSDPVNKFGEEQVGTAGRDKGPFQLTGFDISESGTGKDYVTLQGGQAVLSKHDKDVGAVAAENFLKLQDGAESAVTRNGLYRAFNQSAVEAVSVALKNEFGAAGVHTEALGNLEAAVDYSDAMVSTHKALGDLKKEINKVRTNNAAIPAASVQAAFAGFKPEEQITKLNDARAKIVNPADRLEFDSQTKWLSDTLNDLVQMKDSYAPTGGTAATNTFVIGDLVGRIDNVSKNIGYVGIKKGQGDKYLKSLVDNSILRGETPFRSQGDTKALGKAIQEYNEIKHAAGETSFIENVQRVSYISGRTYSKNDVRDILSGIENGKLIQNLVWADIKARIGGNYGPNALGDFLKSTHYFGLKYDPDYDSAKYRIVGNVGQTFKSLTPYNRFKVDLRDVGLGKVSVIGGEHFQGALNVYSLFTSHDPADRTLGKLGAVLNARGEVQRGFRDGGSSLIRFLNTQYVEGLQIDVKDFTKYANQVSQFKDYLVRNASKFGLRIENGIIVDDTANAAILGALITKLGVRNQGNIHASITWERLGHLQKLTEFANIIQNKYFKGVSKIAAPFFQLRSVVYTKVSKYLTGLVIKSLAATTGIGVILAPLIKLFRPLIDNIIMAISIKVEDFVKAALTLNLPEFFKSMEKLTNNSIKIVLYVLGAPFFIITLLAFMFMGSSLTTFSPVDTTEMSNLGAAPGDGYPVGTGNYAGCTDVNATPPYANPGGSSVSTANCFSFEMPSSTYGQYVLMPWDSPGARREAFDEAIRTLQQRAGPYLDKLCEGAGTIHLYRSSSNPGFCAQVFGDTIVFNSTCSYTNQDYLNYLFAHETGHVADNKIAGAKASYALATANEDTFTTYPLACGSTSNDSNEDFAETIGNWVQANVCDCRAPAGGYGGTWEGFWNQRPAHRDWMRTYFGL